MAISDRRPLDFLAPTGYQFVIRRIPTASYSVQKVNIPGMSLGSADQANPFVTIPRPGEHVLFNEFRVTFKVDQDLKNYLDIWNWIRGLGKVTSFDDYAGLPLEPGTGVTSEASLMVLDAKKQPRTLCTLHSAWPTSISDLVFDATTRDIQYITAEAQFRYVHFDFTPQNS